MSNQIRDTCPLVGLTNLTELWLGNNGISDISPLANLTNLTWLHLYDNQIADICPLASLIKLWWVQVDDNQISDIVPLIDNEGLLEGDTVRLENNPLSSGSVNMYIPELEARGVTVSWAKTMIYMRVKSNICRSCYLKPAR
jgi:Leucine-rich repeat (LRR) protein